MSLRINDVAPDFTAETTQGTIHFHDWIGNNWAVLFSHPKDFTPICTTELGSMAVLYDDFAKRGAKILAVSVDTVQDHKNWVKDIQDVCGSEVKYPIIADTELKVAKLYGMLPADAGDTSAGRTPALNATVRNVYIIGPDKKIKLILIYPMSAGRNFHEILRALDAIQMTTNHPVSTPANWNPGDDIVIGGSVSNEQAATQFPGFKTIKPYLRTAAAPK
ncbi:MAG TPA: peroxiredoxin [Acidobacteriaceae bacterium]|jgi:alkyl hydroperoxide reductase subunit AhpC|nr:peroxiredoxin [Acidobacteriaceae bacterium]